MAPQTRRTAFPKVLIESDTDSEQSSSEEEEEEEEQEEDPPSEEENENKDKIEDSNDAKKKGKATITISLKKVCKVCKKAGHEAGFKGATYIDCPMKPCFLCKMPGHTTMTCPHRVTTEHGVIPAPHKNIQNPVEFIFERQLRPGITSIKPPYVIPDQVNCAAIRYHSRRVTCLEFHPTNNHILLSGDKKGQLGVWDFAKVHEKTVYGNIHSCILNNMRFSPANDGTIYAASSDGTISCTDLETGISSSLINLNPDGWQLNRAVNKETETFRQSGYRKVSMAPALPPSLWQLRRVDKGPASWRMLYGMDINSEKSVVLVADNFGFLYLVDARSNSQTGKAIMIHKKGSKVVGLHCNPFQPDLLLSCGNDHFARLWDMRRLEAGSSLCNLEHRRVVNSAYFSPLSGCKILTTSQDNRLRIWDSIFGNLDSPSREIVHSHDFNRHLTPFRAEWDPKDPSESLAVIGRYISENYNGTALHPIDFIDINTGQLVAEVMDPNITTITPVNKLHPRDDVLASGSSRSLFIWRPKEKYDDAERLDMRKIVVFGGDEKKHGKKSRDEYDDDDSDDEKFNFKGKNVKAKKSKKETTPYCRKAKR